MSAGKKVAVDNQPPVSLADELRKLVEKWPHEEKLYGDPQVYYCHRCAVEALLRQHAAEQPKLTEALVSQVLMTHAQTHPNVPVADCIGFILDELHETLLTAPVAPPPQREPWFKPFASCDWCGQTTHDERQFGKSCSNGGGLMREACRGTYRLNPIFEKTAQPPVAPGEQPPQVEVCGMCGDFLQGDYCSSCDAHVDEDARNLPPTPPAQERDSDEALAEKWREAHLVHRKLLPAIIELIAETRATAAKLAREEAPGPLVSRHGLYTTPDFPCPYCKNPAYLYHIGGGKSIHARVQFTHLAGGNDCVKARTLAVQPSPQLETSVAEKLSNGMKSASRLARQLGKRVAPQKEDGK